MGHLGNMLISMQFNHSKGCRRPLNRNAIILQLSFMCSNSPNQCNLEFCQHFVASRDLEPSKFTLTNQNFNLYFWFAIIFSKLLNLFLVLFDASKFEPF